MPGLPRALATLVLPLGLLFGAGCATSGPSLYSATQVPYPDYAQADELRGLSRSTICHANRAITIVDIAVEEHLRHGDYFGACTDENRQRHASYYRPYASAD